MGHLVLERHRGQRAGARPGYLALLLVVVLGCTPPAAPAPARVREVYVHVDPWFPAEPRARLERAIETWNRTLNGHVRLTVVEDQPSIVNVRWVTPDTPGPKGAIAWADRVGGNEINFYSDVQIDFVEPAALHEFAHIFGAEHVKGTGTIMEPEVATERVCVDETTGRQVARFLRLDPESLNTCRGFK